VRRYARHDTATKRPRRAGEPAEAGDRDYPGPRPDTTSAGPPQAGTAGRPRYAVVTCRIVRHTPYRLRTAIDPEAVCVACPTIVSPVPVALVVVEAAGLRIVLAAGICTRCAPRRDPDLIAAAYVSLRALAPSLRPLAAGGSS
jgi:hypothetical protein